MFTILALGLMVSLTQVGKAEPMGTAWTYQGRLMDTNEPADGLYDFQFKLFDANVAGTQQGNMIDVNEADVIDGYFTVELDFSSEVFNGDARWLEIAVRPGDSTDPNAFVTLSPRQEVTPIPYALQTRGIFVNDRGNVGIGTTNPSEKLDVEGNIDVSSNRIQNYYGFPRPNYDSGWVSIAAGTTVTLTHNLGGNVDNYVLNMQFKGMLGIHCHGYGHDRYLEIHRSGAYYRDLKTDTISVFRYSDDIYIDQVRIRIWVYD